MNKNEFIDLLTKNDPKQIQEFIINKGKPRKLYCPITIFNTDTDYEKEKIYE